MQSNFWDHDSALKQGGFYIQETCETNKKFQSYAKAKGRGFQSFWSNMQSFSPQYMH